MIAKGLVTYLCADDADALMSLRNWSVVLRSFSHHSTSLVASSHWHFLIISPRQLPAFSSASRISLRTVKDLCTLTKDMDSVGVVFFLLCNPLTSSLSFLFLWYGSSITKWGFTSIMGVSLALSTPTVYFGMWQPLLNPSSSTSNLLITLLYFVFNIAFNS